MEYGPDADAEIDGLAGLFNRNLLEPTDWLARQAPGAGGLKEMLQNEGVLARPKFLEVATGQKIELGADWASLAMNRQDEALVQQVQGVGKIGPRRKVAVDELEKIAQDPQNSILYFGPSVEDAEFVAFLLRNRGVNSAFISGETERSVRRERVREFRQGAVKVLCNCEVLTTGFDAPRVTDVVIARPTVSRVLYEQMIGRGLRGTEFGGTEVTRIWNLVDEFPGKQHGLLGYSKYREIWGI